VRDKPLIHRGDAEEFGDLAIRPLGDFSLSNCVIEQIEDHQHEIDYPISQLPNPQFSITNRKSLNYKSSTGPMTK